MKKGLEIYILMVLAILILFVCLISLAAALPPLPTEFYGRVRDYNLNASAGSLVQAYDSSGVLCGSFTIVNSGFYGSLTCRGDDPETTSDEGAAPGESIVFRYKGSYTTIIGNNTWDYGVFRYVNLTYPVVFCGDYFCDSLYENSSNCPFDCPVYNGSYNYSTNMTNMTGNYTGEPGTGGGGGNQGRDDNNNHQPISIIPDYYLNSGFNITGQESIGYQCAEHWICGNWSGCSITGFQNRKCIDKSNCSTFETKPSEVQKCIYTPTCFDGVMNGLEEGIDCGGLCPPCISCFDSIQNCHEGSCEEGTDCGGPCLPCATCSDGKENCHDGSCEEGTDCGGPCERKCPKVQIPRLIIACKKEFNPFSNNSLIFFILMLVVIGGDIFYSVKKIESIKKKKELNDIKKIKLIFQTRRRMYLFIFIVLLISLILYLYFYFFVMCEVEYQFAWILLALLIILPLIIHQVIRYMEYSEKKRLKKIEVLLNTHYKQIENLIKIENENLIELEEELADDLYRLLEKSLHDKKMDESEAKMLKKIYKELISLYSMYKERKNPMDNERILCDDIYEVLESPEHRRFIMKDAKLTGIISKLKLLYKQYEEKQRLYDEMGKIEYSRNELKYELDRET